MSYEPHPMRKTRRNCTTCGTTIRRGQLYVPGPSGLLQCLYCAPIEFTPTDFGPAESAPRTEEVDRG